MRVTRVYPLLIVAALLTGLLEWVALDNPHRPFMWILARDDREVKRFIWALLGCSGFKGLFGALAPAYTISLELFYYAIWGLAMKAAAGRGRQALLIATAVGLVLIVFGARIGARSAGSPASSRSSASPCCQDGFSAPRWRSWKGR